MFLTLIIGYLKGCRGCAFGCLVSSLTGAYHMYISFDFGLTVNPVKRLFRTLKRAERGEFGCGFVVLRYFRGMVLFSFLFPSHMWSPQCFGIINTRSRSAPTPSFVAIVVDGF